ncbi:Glutamate receptor 1 [Folsomia candida]|uniref:Glutamate receptor 1 n=1 Tax=Folsomia candida TaxID=158441 RepID=A0A226DGE8_FOLCA|nr:Glutamate receptor 1 [Folsomia candida]
MWLVVVVRCALNLLLVSSSLVHVEAEKIPLGAVFEQGTTQTQTAFKYALAVRNGPEEQRRGDVEFQAFVNVINTADAFKLSRIICHHFSRGVFAMVGAVSPESFDTFHSYANTFQMPFLTPWFPEKMVSSMLDFATSMKPEFHRALIDTIHYYGWRSIIYLYCNMEASLPTSPTNSSRKTQIWFLLL